MTGDMVRTLYRYSTWATARILDHAARLRPEELAKPSGASFSSVRETLVHIMAAQWIWLARWKGSSPTSLLDARVVEYKNTHGERWAYPLWQQVVHQVNHATQHRGEVAAALTELGHSPGDLDLLIYIDETEPRRRTAPSTAHPARARQARPAWRRRSAHRSDRTPGSG